jgi:chromate reductase
VRVGQGGAIDGTFHILGIPGSLREQSYNRRLLAAAGELAPEGVEIETFTLEDIPPYNGDLDGERSPGPVRRLRERIAAADALLIATPEYNTAVPGVLKNAIDWASRPFPNSVLLDKPVALMGCSIGPFATVRAQGDLRLIFTATGSYVLPRPQVALREAAQYFDEVGGLADENVRNGLRMLLDALVTWSRRLRPD